MDYITLHAAAAKMGITYMAAYRAVKRKSLKAVTMKTDFYKPVMHTTEGWIAEYQKNNNNRELHSRFNGKRTFDETKQEFCVKRVAAMLGIRKQSVYWLIYTGQLHTFKKGSYHVVTQSSIESYINKTQVTVTELVS